VSLALLGPSNDTARDAALRLVFTAFERLAVALCSPGKPPLRLSPGETPLAT
jgi:hypothetical protein